MPALMRCSTRMTSTPGRVVVAVFLVSVCAALCFSSVVDAASARMRLKGYDRPFGGSLMEPVNKFGNNVSFFFLSSSFHVRAVESACIVLFLLLFGTYIQLTLLFGSPVFLIYLFFAFSRRPIWSLSGGDTPAKQSASDTREGSHGGIYQRCGMHPRGHDHTSLTR